MLDNTECNNRIKRIHEGTLWTAYSDHRNLQVLVIEVYQFLNILSPKIMGKIFQFSDHNCTLRTDISFRSYTIHVILTSLHMERQRPIYIFSCCFSFITSYISYFNLYYGFYFLWGWSKLWWAGLDSSNWIWKQHITPLINLKTVHNTTDQLENST